MRERFYKSVINQKKKRNIGILLAVALLVNCAPSVSFASPSETQQQINATEQEIDRVEGQQNQNQQELSTLQGERASLQSQLATLNQQLTEVSERLADLEQQIQDKEDEIEETREALEDARKQEAWQYECMEIRIRFTYEQGKSGLFSGFLSEGGFMSLLNQSVYVESILEYDDKMLDELIANREYIESEEARLEVENEELNRLKVDAEAEQNKVSGLISQTSQMMRYYADQISETQAMIEENEKELERLDGDLDALKKKLEEEIAMSRKAAQASWRSIEEVSFADGDRYLLANLIYCEAGGEPYEGQLAVGAVVINRVLSSVYPGTVVGVIYQSSQFSPVASGRLDLALANNYATQSCYQAADEAMAGMTNVGNCVYFRTPIEGLTGINIGGHVFY